MILFIHIKVFRLFPLVLVATILILLVVVAVAFRSLGVALRLIFTLALTLSWCFGAGVIVFQTSAFNWYTNKKLNSTSQQFLIKKYIHIRHNRSGQYMSEITAFFWVRL